MSIISTVLFFQGFKQPELAKRITAPSGGSLGDRQARKLQNRQIILDAIAEGFQTVHEICDETELSKSAVQGHINVLVDEKLIRKIDGERRGSLYHYQVCQ